MISKAEADQIARDYIADIQSQIEEPVAIQDDLTIEEDFGWAFFYNSKKYIETQHFAHQLAGNAPFIVLRRDGSIRMTGTAEPIEFYLDAIRAELQE